MPPKKKAKAEPVSTPVASPQPKYVWMVQHSIKVVIEKFGKDMTDGHSGYTFSEHDDEEDEEMIEERRAHASERTWKCPKLTSLNPPLTLSRRTR